MNFRTYILKNLKFHVALLTLFGQDSVTHLLQSSMSFFDEESVLVLVLVFGCRRSMTCMISFPVKLQVLSVTRLVVAGRAAIRFLKKQNRFRNLANGKVFRGILLNFFWSTVIIYFTIFYNNNFLTQFCFVDVPRENGTRRDVRPGMFLLFITFLLILQLFLKEWLRNGLFNHFLN